MKRHLWRRPLKAFAPRSLFSGAAALCALVMLGAWFAGCGPAAQSAKGAPTQAPPALRARMAPILVHSPFAIATGPDGNLWFTEYQAPYIGRMTPQGDVKRFRIADKGFAERITAGPDGALWFSDPFGNQIGRITVDGKVGYVKLPNPGCGPAGIAAARGYIYFSEHRASRIGRLSPAGKLTEFTLPPGSGPGAIAVAPDGSVYFAEDRANRIGRLSTAGKLTEFPVPTPGSVPGGLAIDAGGDVYFTELAAAKIGKLTPDGKITEFILPRDDPPLSIAAGLDGNLWVTAPRGHLIYRVTPSGQVSIFGGVESGIAPAFITPGPDGSLYFTEPAGIIGRITTAGKITEFLLSR